MELDLTPFQKRKSPIRVLQVLSQAVGPMARKTIAPLTGLMMENERIPSETNTYKFLTSEKYVTEKDLTFDDDHTETVYAITQKGRKVLEEMSKLPVEIK